jgi:integrase
MEWQLDRDKKYDRNFIGYILADKNLTPEQKKVLNDYSVFKVNIGVGINSRSRYLWIMKDFLLFVKKPVDKITREDIEKYLYKIRDLAESTKTLRKIVIKNFFQWFYKCDKGEYPYLVKSINTTLKADQNVFKGKSDLLSDAEIERLVNACDNLRDRSMIMIMLEWGLRASSIKNLSIKDVKPDGDYLSIYFRGKGKVSGELTLFDSTPDLKAWLSIHRFKDNRDAPLFYCLRGDVGSRLSTQSIFQMVKRLGKKAKIEKNIFPHLLRHVALTKLGKRYTNAELKVVALWKSEAMTKRYIHLDAEDIKRKELVRRGLLPQESGRDNILEKLKTPLDMKSVMVKENEKQNFYEKFDKVMPVLLTFLEQPEVKRILEKK